MLRGFSLYRTKYASREDHARTQKKKYANLDTESAKVNGVGFGRGVANKTIPQRLKFLDIRPAFLIDRSPRREDATGHNGRDNKK